MAKKKPAAKVKRRKESGASADSKTIFQLKITLRGSKPPIWRRIQVADCTLDELHYHIQNAMGWTNSHLHAFEIGGKQYGDPEMLDSGFDDPDCGDSTCTTLGEIIPRTGKPFRFMYEYDFGDCWKHEVLCEGRREAQAGSKYPLCLEGKGACPPEDIGGIYGYYDFVQALADPKHDRHDDYMEWAAEFNPDDFDPESATKAMRSGS